MNKTPQDFKVVNPMTSVFGREEYETVARNIMVILTRTGNTWRRLGWREYKREVMSDGNFSKQEDWDKHKDYFNKVRFYTTCGLKASKFCSAWKNTYEK